MSISYPNIVRLCLRLLLALVVLAALVISPLQPDFAHAQYPTIVLPPGFTQDVVAEKLDGPTSFAFAPDGRIFITRKAGTVRVVQNGQLLSDNFIDISHEVNQMADRGLMSVAVHPQFPAVPFVYLSYTYEPVEAHGFSDRGARVARVLRINADPANPNVHVPGTGVVILGQNSTFENIGNPERPDEPPFSCEGPNGYVQDCLPTEGPAHTVGQLRFGPEGALYVANGDGTVNGAGNMRAQEIDSLAGKILRIDPYTGAAWPGNPFHNGDLYANRSKVYALGMRNPFRFTINPANGELWIGEVGNDVWEEVTRARAGANLGWPCFEGPNPASINPACDPLFNGTTPVTQAIHAYKHEFGLGAAIGGDFYTGQSYPSQYRGQYFFADFNGGLIQTINPATGTANLFASNVFGPVQVQMGPDGNLYWLSIITGTLYRIRYGSPSETSASSPPVTANLPSSVNAEGASPPAPSVPPQVIGTAPTAAILRPADGERFRIGAMVSFQGEGGDAEDGALSDDSLRWEVFLHHREHIHYDFYEGNGAQGSFEFDDHGDNTYFELCLTATDSDGREGQACVNLYPEEVTYTFDTDPSGVPLLYAGSTYTTPFQVVTHVGATRQIGAPRRPVRGVFFRDWSDAGARSHTISIGKEAETLVATYRGNLTALPDVTIPDEVPIINPEAATAGEPRSAASPPAAQVRPAPAPIAVAPPAAAAPTRGTGRILREWWSGISGTSVADLTSNADFPANPTGREFIPRFEGPGPFADDYGTRIRGYLYPPVTGDYRFWLASDDSAELWLSTDEDPANKVRIATVSQWTLQREWDRYGEQASGMIPLEAGRRYYVEALHKEGDQKDNLAAAWQIPGEERAVIEGQYLSPYGGQ